MINVHGKIALRSPRKSGLGMVELLLALAISAMLLTSVAVAFHSSVGTIEENSKVSTITQMARVVLNRMITECRSAADVDDDSNAPVQVGGTDNSDPNNPRRWYSTTHIGISPPTPILAGQPSAIEYEFSNNTLYYRQKIGATTNEYQLISPADNITITNFQILLNRVNTDPNNGVNAANRYFDLCDYTTEVVAKMTLQIGANTFQISASTNQRQVFEW